MSFPIPLHTSFPERLERNYFNHNSGGEHFGLRVSDIEEVQGKRQEQGLTPIDNLAEIMYKYGLRVIRRMDGRLPGEMVGYASVSRSRDFKDLTLEGLWVDENHRHQGIGGYLLGRLLTGLPGNYDPIWLEREPIGKTLQWNDRRFLLPGVIVSVGHMIYGQKVEPELHQRFYDSLPEDWTGLLMSRRKGHAPAEQFLNGKIIASFTRSGLNWTIDGDPSKRKYDNVAFAAIDALNK